MAFDLEDFLPYRLNQAAECASQGFAAYYRERYGLTRTDWRVLFHISQYGPISAIEISKRAGLHKTPISRAIQKLEARGWLDRVHYETEKRSHDLKLTRTGQTIFADLAAMATEYDRHLRQALGPTQTNQLLTLLRKIETFDASQIPLSPTVGGAKRSLSG